MLNALYDAVARARRGSIVLFVAVGVAVSVASAGDGPGVGVEKPFVGCGKAQAMAARFLAEIAQALAPGGRLLIAEPRGHVSEEALEITRAAAESAGLSLVDRPAIKRSRTALLEKPR